MLDLSSTIRAIKFSTSIAIIASVLGLIVFLINFYGFNGQMPFYALFNYPGLFFISFFSEEIDFWPKLSLLIAGQFGGYFIGSLFILTLTSASARVFGTR